MPIDWFTVVAQAFNFLILVWLLKRFLYGPILRAIDKRERGIADQFAAAKAKMADADKEREAFRLKNEEIDRQRAALLAEATAAAESERQRLLEAARKDVDSLRVKHLEALRKEQLNLGREITRWTQREVFAVTRRALADLASASLEERIVDVFVGRLRGLDGAAREQFGSALKTSGHLARVRTAFDLPQAQRDAVDRAIKETFAPEIQVQFETAPDVVGGIELSGNGRKVAWSIADYLSTLEQSVSKLLQVGTATKSTSGPTAPAAKGAS